ncbi:hypothetical protein ACFL0R_01005 [Pseudomonadota bacterium]
MNWHNGYLVSMAAGLCIWAASGSDEVHAADAGNAAEVVRVEIVLADHKLARESNVIRVIQGQVVELVWLSDEATELHLHGYDVEIQVKPGQHAVMALAAHATGRFPITSHGFGANANGHQTLLYLEVYPGE